MIGFMPIFNYVYFALLQTYVLKLEIILNILGLAIVCLEIAATLIGIISISKQEKEL